MFDKMKQLMEMKKKAEAIKLELDATDVECNEVDGIKIVINGSQNFKSIELNENQLKSENKEKLEMDLLRSVNAAVKKSQDLATEKMRSVMPGL